MILSLEVKAELPLPLSCCEEFLDQCRRVYPPYFEIPETGALSHFRNHYFLMGLVVRFQKAALLSFSDRLSAAVNLDKQSDKQLANNAKQTQRKILDFCDRYWFIDLSTQSQAKELYALWRRHLKLDGLYAQVTEESRQLNDYLENQASIREERKVTRLTWVGILIAGITFISTIDVFIEWIKPAIQL